jgi:hypothetical protein
MTKVREYFNEKYDKNGPAYMQGVLRTIGKLPPEDEEQIKKDLPDRPEEEVLEK